MEAFKSFLDSIDNEAHKEKMESLLKWVAKTFPNLETTVKWNQPMFTDHGTFIIAFSKAKAHFSVAPEAKALNQFTSQIEAAGYSQTNNLFRVKWTQEIDFSLLEAIIQYNIEDKSECTTFWRT